MIGGMRAKTKGTLASFRVDKSFLAIYKKLLKENGMTFTARMRMLVVCDQFALKGKKGKTDE